MAERTRVQHYVPQLYLRGFTNASGRLFCFDKANERSYPVAPRDAACESDFYEDRTGNCGERIPDNAVEKALGTIEAAWTPLLADLIRSADAGAITDAQVMTFAPFLATQWMRTKTYRDHAFEMLQKHGQTFVDDLVQLNFPESAGKVTFHLNRDSMVGVHAHQIFDLETVERMANDLEHHYWVVGLTDVAHPFYTSDHPVVRRANRSNSWRQFLGTRDPGIEFAFPLDSTHLLVILEKTHFAEWRDRNNRAVRFAPDQVADYNGLQVRRSCQRVYCASDDFDLAKGICTAEPAVRDPNRPRVNAGSTPMVDVGPGEKNRTYVIALE